MKKGKSIFFIKPNRWFKFFWIFFVSPLGICAKPTAIYLTWSQDPTTTMSIQWISKDHPIQNVISVKKRSDSDNKAKKWIAKTDVFDSYAVSKINLTRLNPNTEYEFCFEKDAGTYRFKTAPLTLDAPLRFAVGGDACHDVDLFRNMCRVVQRFDPLFVVLGGDLAYAEDPKLTPDADRMQRWVDFFSDWASEMISDEGRLIPIIAIPGNHDVRKTGELFSRFFPLDQGRAYQVMDFGDYLSFFLLDTGYFSEIGGDQTAWLKGALSARSHTWYRFPVYHEAAFPSYFCFDETHPFLIRSNWVPLFEKYKVSAVFEHHNHTFKRTYPIKNNQIDSEGIVYLGDGCFGAPPRKPHEGWFFEKQAQSECVFFVEISKEKGVIQARNQENKRIDEFSILPFSDTAKK